MGGEGGGSHLLSPGTWLLSLICTFGTDPGWTQAHLARQAKHLTVHSCDLPQFWWPLCTTTLCTPSKWQLYSSTQSWVVRAEKVCVAGFSHSLHPPDAPLTSPSTIHPSDLSHLQNLEPVTCTCICTCTKFTSIHLLLSLAPNSCSCSSLNSGFNPYFHWQLKCLSL